ncbi:hypothetical protein [Devosia alba]|uniref:hypothetical protein n=1 Tax=Devosia alba TaxID=3152360 RepID=UPI003264548B
MAVELIPRTSETDKANRLVGRFLQHFALVEEAIDSGLTKLLGLDSGVSDIVAANVPLAKKIDILFSAENLLAEMPDSERGSLLKKTRSQVLSLNNNRIIAAHCRFDAIEEGAIVFRRVVAKGKLKIESVEWDEGDVERFCTDATVAAAAISTIVSELIPYQPRLDFSDPRNSMYLPLL